MHNRYVFIWLFMVASSHALQTNEVPTADDMQEQKEYIEHIQKCLRPLLEKHSFFKDNNPHQKEVEAGLEVLKEAVQKSYELRNKRAACAYKHDAAYRSSCFYSSTTYNSKQKK